MKQRCFYVVKTSTKLLSLHYLGFGTKIQACLHQPSWPSWNRRLCQGCCAIMGTISHASNRMCLGWLSILMDTAAVTTSLKSICACGKTAVKVRAQTSSHKTHIFYLCGQERHLSINWKHLQASFWTCQSVHYQCITHMYHAANSIHPSVYLFAFLSIRFVNH